MPTLLITLDFETESELRDKLECLKDQLLDSVIDRATQMPLGPLWQGDEHSLYLIPSGFGLEFGIEEDEELPNLLELDEDEVQKLAELEELGPETGIFAAGTLADERL